MRQRALLLAAMMAVFAPAAVSQAGDAETDEHGSPPAGAARPPLLKRTITSRKRVQRQRPVETRLVADQPPTDPFGAVLHSSEEAITLLSRATEAVERKDWKLVVDSLQRIIELPGDHVLTSDGLVYESARQHAQRRLSELPPEGRRAYRLVYDGEASALYAQAVAEHDEALLRSLLDRSLLTSVGDEAAVTLAAWMIDEGRFPEATAILRRLQSIYPDSDLPTWVVPGRLAVCYAGMGRPAAAATLLDNVAASQPALQDPQQAERLDSLREFISRPGLANATQIAFTTWPMPYGRPNRDGNMPAVEPTFLTQLPWNVPLPIAQNRVSIGAMEQYARRRELSPVAELVTDGRVMVVKAGTHLLGLDADTFDPIWSTHTQAITSDLIEMDEAAAQPQNWRLNPGRQDEERLDRDPLLRRLYYDSVGGQATIAENLVLTIEWPEDPPDTLAIRRFRRTDWRGGPAGVGDSQPNFVVAYSPTDGELMWTSDTSSGPAALGPVEFMSVPIPVNRLLLAPCRVNADMYAVLLDPATGKTVRHVYLCSTGGGPFDSLYARMCCAVDGMVYIPTGRGVLIALDTSNYSIRWAVRYDGIGRPANTTTWMPTPVIAVSDVVLLAPPDADYLFCLDRMSGEIRWWTERAECQYVLAATDDRVWIVGERVKALEVETGKPIWDSACGTPAGRGARCDDRLYLPTFDGLDIFDANTGKRIDSHVPTTATPMGNVLAWEASLYIVSGFEVQKYPDLTRGYAEALRAHEADTTDASCAMRLAWLEQLKGRPDRVLAVLDHVPDTLKDRDSRRYARLVHLRVLATLELARIPDTQPAEALALLRKAQEMSVDPEDAIASRLALGDYLRDSEAPDGAMKGCLEYASLVMDAAGDQMISEESGTFERRAALVAAGRLADTLKSLSAAQSEALVAEMRTRLWAAVAESRLASIERITQCAGPGDIPGEAGLILAIQACRDLRYEQAESHLLRLLRQAKSPALLAEATARLAVIYLQPGELHMPVAAAKLLDRLEHDFAGIALPADILASEWRAPAQRTGTDETGPASRIAAGLRDRMDHEMLADHRAIMDGVTLCAPGVARSNSHDDSRPVTMPGPRPEPMLDKVLLLTEGRTLEARSVTRGEVLWPAELRLLGELAVETRNSQDRGAIGAGFRRDDGPNLSADALSEGETLVINTRYGIHAVGMLTGRRLWSRRFDPVISNGERSAGSNTWLWVHDGYVMSVDTHGYLDVAPIEAGDRVLWRRRMPQRNWHAVRARGRYVVVVDAEYRQADVFRLADGTFLGQCRFEQPDEPDRKINIALFEDMICGPASAREVVAFDLAVPGVQRWRVEMTHDLSQIFKPSPDLLAIGDRSGRLDLIDPAMGNRKLSTRVPACAQGVVGGRTDGQTLFVFGRETLPENEARTADNQSWAISALRLVDGSSLWNRPGIGPRAFLNDEIFAMSSNAIPLTTFEPSGENMQVHADNSTIRVTRPRPSVGLEVLDKRTGQPLGQTPSAELDSNDNASRILDVQVLPDRIRVVAGTTHLQFAMEPDKAKREASEKDQ